MNQDLMVFFQEIIYLVNVGTHWIALFCKKKIIHFDSFCVEYDPNEIKNLLKNLLKIKI